MSLPAPGFPLSLSRQYDSRAQTPGDFGPGWSLPQAEVKVAVTNALGEDWEQRMHMGGLFNLMYYYTLVPLRRHAVVIRLGETDVLRFEMDVEPNPSTFYPFERRGETRVMFRPAEGTQGTLDAEDFDDGVMFDGDSLILGFRGSDIDVYNPKLFRLTRPDGMTYIIHTEEGVRSMTDPHGHTVSYDRNGIHHSGGNMSITFERDAGDRIRKVTDPDGRETEYHYDENGMLEKVERLGGGGYQNSILAKYAYEAGVSGRTVLKAVKAPDGTELGKFEYDTMGRMTAFIDGGGKRTEYLSDVANHRQEVTDRRGNVTVYEYDSKGNVTKKTDQTGNVTAWTYDDRGNNLTETDPLGNTMTRTYDARGNILTENDPPGNTTAYTYNERNQILTVTDPLGNVTTNTYDDKGKLVSAEDAMGRKTLHAYDSDGSRISSEDHRGNVTEYEYDARGNMIRETGPLNNVTGYTYDAHGNELTRTATRTDADGSVVTMRTENRYDHLGRVTETTDPDGFSVLTEYDQVTGKQSAMTDKRGFRTTYEYDNAGNMKKIIHSDETTEIFTYDAEGNRETHTDRAGRTVTYLYDELNRQVRTVYSDSTYTVRKYDAAGRITLTGDENRNRMYFRYDGAGRKTETEDALGNITKFGYDAAGNQISVTDARGRTTSFEYDVLNRRTKTVYPDNTFATTAYDGCCGKMTSETDQAGRTTTFGYDAAGRLTQVMQYLSGEEIVTSYSYDEAGNKTGQTDPNGNTTAWEYDNMGRIVRHTLPEGMSETFAYDPNGNLKEKTDFNGDVTAYMYDKNNRLTDKIFNGETQISFTYTPTGRRKTVTDGRGTTTYAYDLRSRLKSVGNPDGAEIAYTYDNAGNRTSVTVPSGTTTYMYDRLNRTGKVISPDGDTTYTYDGIGNRKAVTYPNGAVAEYMYDRLNRLIKLENRKSSGELISGYVYTLGPAGNRQRVEELHSGRVVNYAYDDLYRLTSEDVTDPVLGNETVSYTYDRSGNRLTKGSSDGTATYSYDVNDRLEKESRPDILITYGYDGNGNTVSRNSGVDTVTYGYDYENRLVSLENAGSSAVYEYDADGIRTGSAADSSGTSYLVDKNRPYAQVLEERDEGGSLIVSYVYGGDLISQNRNGSVSYYHYDGLGSVTALSDEAGNVTDSYVYGAFGNLRDRLGTTVNNYLYTGEQYDPDSGFYYLRARHYMPETGRFATIDPFEGHPGNPLTLHRYMYANDNPVMFVDPGGEFAFSIASVLVITELGTSCLNDFFSSLAELFRSEDVLLYTGSEAEKAKTQVRRLKDKSLTAREIVRKLEKYIKSKAEAIIVKAYRGAIARYQHSARTVDYDPYVNDMYVKYAKYLGESKREKWHTRPAEIALAHELIHALHHFEGSHSPIKDVEEAKTVGYGIYSGYPYTENKIRDDYGIPRRPRYEVVPSSGWK